MQCLPSDSFKHIATFFSTSEAFVYSQVSKSWYKDLQQCAWLWRQMSFHSDVQLQWYNEHRYNTRSKRKREIVNMPNMLTIKGGNLQQLVFGSVTQQLLTTFGNLELLLIAQTCPRLKSLELYTTGVDLTQWDYRYLFTLCPDLESLSIPVSGFTGLENVPVPANKVTTLRLHGNMKHLNMSHPTCFGNVTSLYLDLVHNLTQLDVLLQHCPKLQHLTLVECVNDQSVGHPLHVLDSNHGAVDLLMTSLKSLNVLRCETVVCMPYLVRSLYNNRWNQLEVFGVDDSILAELIEDYDWFNGLFCEDCPDERVVVGFFGALQFQRCASCRQHAPTLRTVIAF